MPRSCARTEVDHKGCVVLSAVDEFRQSAGALAPWRWSWLESATTTNSITPNQHTEPSYLPTRVLYTCRQVSPRRLKISRLDTRLLEPHPKFSGGLILRAWGPRYGWFVSFPEAV